MYSEDDLDAAVSAGILSAEAAHGFRAFVAARHAAPAVDEEHFRLLSGFNDIFVSIAAVLMLVAVGWLGTTIHAAAGWGAVAVTAWGLGEYFTRRRRMALPSILLLGAFVLGVFVGGLELVGAASFDFRSDESLRIAACAAVTALAAYAHWRRFMVPVTMAAGALAAIATLAALVAGAAPSLMAHWMMPLLLAGGLAVFILAMRWDSSDRNRTTRRSDVAFWLHMAAAPLIVHPIFSVLGLLGGGDVQLGRALAAVAIYAVLALLALAVDRRALLVSALVYVLYAMSALFRAAGSMSESFALTALVIGSALLLLSALWHRARAAVVGCLPAAIRQRLPVV